MPIFHQKQSFGHCAIHALNNLIQRQWVTYGDCASIAETLHQRDKAAGIASAYSFNPYCSIMPYWGQFDINVIAEALKSQQCVICDHILAAGLSVDEANFISQQKLCDINGIIVNQEILSFGILRSRHWFAIAKIEGTFVNVDSLLHQPFVFETDISVNLFLANVIRRASGQIFLVCREPPSSIFTSL